MVLLVLNGMINASGQEKPHQRFRYISALIDLNSTNIRPNYNLSGIKDGPPGYVTGNPVGGSPNDRKPGHANLHTSAVDAP